MMSEKSKTIETISKNTVWGAPPVFKNAEYSG
jgi:hypothetical protein